LSRSLSFWWGTVRDEEVDDITAVIAPIEECMRESRDLIYLGKNI